MSKEEKIKTFRSKGNICFKNKKFSDAISYYREGLQLDPGNPHLNSNLAQAYLEERDFASAEYYAKIAIANSKDSAKGYFRAAKASAGLGDNTKAIKYLEDGINCCNMSDTEDLRHYLRTLYDKDPTCIGVTSKSPQEDVNEIEDLPSLTSDSDSDEDMNSDKLRSRSTSRMPASASFLGVNKELQSLLKEGSEIMASGLSRKAVEKYKAALHMILDHTVENFKMKEIDLIVLKYALCICWIQLAGYGDIVKAVEYLKDIEDNRVSKFPAVYYGLGRAYYKLNRYKVAAEHLEKGLLFLKRGVTFETHSWPGTNDVISETTRNGLEDGLKGLLKMCRVYHEPDAICKYNQCHKISSHIIPSEHIFYSDPDFSGFVTVICQEKCRIEYHLGCWKDYKEAIMSTEIGKLSDKDFIGRSCPTTDCVTQANECSVITKIEIVGDDATVRTSIEAPKVETPIKESKKAKKRKNEKSTEVAAQEKPKSKPVTKIKKTLPETVQTASQETQATSSAEELALRLDRLKRLREFNFGYTDDHWNPKENHYGREDILSLDHFLSPEITEETEESRGKKEFIFSYFFEFIRNEGPQKIKEVELKWQNEVGKFEGVYDCMSSHTSICNFLLQSYRFATIDDYMCLAEQLADTYNTAKTELVESLSFTLSGFINRTDPVTDMSLIDNNIKMGIEYPMYENPNVVPEFESLLKSNIHTHISDSKTAVESMLGPFADKPSGSTSNSETLIPHAGVDVLSEDPDISTAEDNVMRTNERRFISVSEGISCEEENMYSFSSDISSYDSDEIDSRCHQLDDDGVEQQKNLDTQKEKTWKNEEKDNGMVNVEEETKGLKNSLNIYASAFEPSAKVVPQEEQKDSYHREDAETKTAARLVSAPAEEIQLNAATSEYNAFTHSKPGWWRLEEGQTEGSGLYQMLAYSQRTAVPPVTADQFQVPHLKTSTSPALPLHQFPKSSDGNTLTDEIRNFEEKIKVLESTVKTLEMELKNEKNENEIHKKTSELKVEELEKKIKELELERTEVVEGKDEDIRSLKEKLSKKEEECEAEKSKCEEVKSEKEISENRAKEIMRNLISETGQKVKELEEELEVRKRDMKQYQHLVLKAKKETGEVQIKFLKQKCFDVLEAMRCRVKYLTDSGIPTKTDIAVAIKNWEQYLLAITEHEIQFRVHCTSLNEKSGNITLADFIKLEWPDPPKEPSCPLDLLEEVMLKALDEVESMKEKLITQDKEMLQVKAEQLKFLNGLTVVEEQRLKLGKAIEDRQKKVTNPLIGKEPALQPGVVEEMNKAVEQLGPSDPKGEAKAGKTPEQLMQSEEKGLKQNINSGAYFASPFQVNPLIGVPIYQNSTQGYGYQPALPSSPYFCHPQMPVPMQPAPPVTIFSSPFQPNTLLSSMGSDKPPVQQQAEPKPASAVILTEFTKIPTSAASVAGKSQPPLGSREVPEKKKSPSPASGFTPAEITKTVPTPSTSPTVASQGLGIKTVPKGSSSAASSVDISKQKVLQMSNPSDAPKPPLQMPSETPTASAVKPSSNNTSAPKPKTGSYQKLMKELRKHFPTKTDEELASSVAVVRARNNNSLTGQTVPSIINMVDKVLKDKSSKKQGSMGLDRFGGAAWGGVQESASGWAKSNQTSKDDCIICFESMEKDLTSLHCKHSFHTECIRQWLRTESVCPICRLFTRMADEFPPLS
ncbi:hypothetical protein B7P43_G09381 [Cryptotermes secundus]|uniref:RING-type domain-containing protein n=1 Tax=Cryptotermes secundus TaxID=105785 RepID=A0A2J7QJ41_9NEOP|nr:hypothetical protein B7P43_G09381 [Cryptotermes secundus]